MSFQIGLIQTKFQNTSTARPFFSDEAQRDIYFKNKVDTTGVWTSAINLVLNDNVSMDIVIKRDITDLVRLLRYNYCVLIYPTGEYRYFYATLTQDVSGQVNAHLELDDYTQNYIRIKNGVVAQVERATVTALPTGNSASLINISENVQESKVMTGRSIVPLVNPFLSVDEYIREEFNKTIWCYFYIKPNAYMADLPTYKSNPNQIANGVDTQQLVICAPLTGSWYYEWRDFNTNPPTTHIDMWNALGIMSALGVTQTLNVNSANMDLVRILQNSGLPTGTQTLETSLTPYLTNIKLSMLPPFTVQDYQFTDGFIYRMPSNPNNLVISQGMIGTVNPFKYGGLVISRLWRGPQPCIIPMPTVEAGKFGTSDFKEYRLTNHKGDYFSFDVSKIVPFTDKAQPYFKVNIYEELSPNATDNYMSIEDNGYFYKYNNINYNGVVTNTDMGIPMYIDALSEYFSTNKNSIAQNELERSSIQQQYNADKERRNQQHGTTWQGLGSIVGNVLNFGKKNTELAHDQQLADRQNAIAQTKQSVQEVLQYDNLQYSPPKISGTGDILFNIGISGLTPTIDIYEVEQVIKDKYTSYFAEFGYKIGMVYDLNLLDNDPATNLYLECMVLRTEAVIADIEFSRIKNLLKDGVLRSKNI